jgi:hypothetical protein
MPNLTIFMLHLLVHWMYKVVLITSSLLRTRPEAFRVRLNRSAASSKSAFWKDMSNIAINVSKLFGTSGYKSLRGAVALPCVMRPLYQTRLGHEQPFQC